MLWSADGFADRFVVCQPLEILGTHTHTHTDVLSEKCHHVVASVSRDMRFVFPMAFCVSNCVRVCVPISEPGSVALILHESVSLMLHWQLLVCVCVNFVALGPHRLHTSVGYLVCAIVFGSGSLCMFAFVCCPINAWFIPNVLIWLELCMPTIICPTSLGGMCALGLLSCSVELHGGQCFQFIFVVGRW